VRVSQEFINLLNLPLPELESIAEELDVEIPTGARKWDVVRLLSQVGSKKLAPHASRWIFAGKTSVTFIRLGDGTPLDRKQVVSALIELCEGENPLTTNVRPEELTRRPALVDATEFEGKIFLSFGLKKPVAEVIADFEIRPVEADEFFVAVLRPDSAIIEVRTNNQRARRFASTWLADFCDLVDEQAGAAA
jgi:hypothetical protein